MKTNKWSGQWKNGDLDYNLGSDVDLSDLNYNLARVISSLNNNVYVTWGKPTVNGKLELDSELYNYKFENYSHSLNSQNCNCQGGNLKDLITKLNSTVELAHFKNLTVEVPYMSPVELNTIPTTTTTTTTTTTNPIIPKDDSDDEIMPNNLFGDDD